MHVHPAAVVSAGAGRSAHVAEAMHGNAVHALMSVQVAPSPEYPALSTRSVAGLKVPTAPLIVTWQKLTGPWLPKGTVTRQGLRVVTKGTRKEKQATEREKSQRTSLR